MTIHVIPTKKGYWRAVKMSELRHAYWLLAWNKWWLEVGHTLEPSLEMWKD